MLNNKSIKTIKITTILIISLSFIWVGLIMGISFLEAPLKFQVPDITLVIALGIGKLVFSALNKIEWIISILIIISLVLIKSNKKIWILYSLPIIILIIQSIWFLPELMQRAEMIINKQELPESNSHILFAICEGLKFIAILTAGIIFTKKNIK